ncbi:MAG: agmatinase [Candidatus Aenigmatarchaeota archaeon]|nr:MAG: agmatinase [Candidatus Aenigmarchaeota archaeon]
MNELYVENPLEFWCNNYGVSSADVVFLGVPFDGTSTGRAGSREAPNAIRSASYNLETNSAYTEANLADLKMTDYGNLITVPGDTEMTLKRLEDTVFDIKNKFPVIVGGEHIVTLPVIRSLIREHPTLKVLQFDAHLDLRNEYIGNRYSHVTVMRRIFEILGKKRIIQVGARSFSDDEKDFAKKNTVLKTPENLLKYAIKGPVYITIDMDVFDPSVAPGVSTPAPAGFVPERFFDLIHGLKNKLEVVGFDVVETCPPHDDANMTSLLAAEIIKEMILAFRK